MPPQPSGTERAASHHRVSRRQCTTEGACSSSFLVLLAARFCRCFNKMSTEPREMRGLSPARILNLSAEDYKRNA